MKNNAIREILSAFSKSKTLRIANMIEKREILETKEILMRKDEEGISVAHWLAVYYFDWTTEELEVLSLVNNKGETVEDILVKNGKM